jgi:hypothetical protein
MRKLVRQTLIHYSIILLIALFLYLLMYLTRDFAWRYII